MTGIESLDQIKDQDAVNNIREMTECFASKVSPLKVILFGSFADGTYSDQSDFDFYIVVEDERSIGEVTEKLIIPSCL